MKLEDTKRIVIKIGSAILFDPISGSLNKNWLNSLGASKKRYIISEYKV